MSVYSEPVLQVLMIISLCVRSLRDIRRGSRRAAPGGFDRRSPSSHHSQEAGRQRTLPQTPAASARPQDTQQPALRETPRLPHRPLRRMPDLKHRLRVLFCTNKPCIIQDEHLTRTYTDSLHHVRLFQCNVKNGADAGHLDFSGEFSKKRE